MNFTESIIERQSRVAKFTPLGVIVLLLGVVLFFYFIKTAGVNKIGAGIRDLGFGFLIILAISSIRHIVRSLAWVLCVEAPNRLRFFDAFRARLMGDAI